MVLLSLLGDAWQNGIGLHSGRQKVVTGFLGGDTGMRSRSARVQTRKRLGKEQVEVLRSGQET